MSGLDPKTCFDRGDSEKWEHRALFEGLEYRKNCLSKGGWAHGVAVDYDALVAVVGQEKAREVLAAGRPVGGRDLT